MARVLEIVFRFRNYIAAAPLLYALVSTRQEWENDAMIWPIAVALAVLGAGIRFWSNRHCNYNTRAQNRLATTGPYALTRNPLYVGNASIILAGNVASELEWLLPITALWMALVYSIVVWREERRLREKYGTAYDEYCDRVPRWIPRWRYGRSRDGGTRTCWFGAWIRECVALLILIPFVIKELNPLGVWG